MARFQIEHSAKNLINIESDGEGDGASNSSCDAEEEELLEYDDYIKEEQLKKHLREKFPFLGK